MTESQDEMPVPWQTLTELLRTVAEQATFDVRHRGIYSASQFRDIYYRSTDVDSLLVLSAEPRVRDDLRAQLTRSLRTLLSRYILYDNIGHIIQGVVSSTGFPVTSFALDLVMAASILGPERVTQLLLGWVNGEPFPYRTCAVLSGVSVADPLEMHGGVRFENAPETPYVAPDHLAFSAIQSFGGMPAMRTVIVTIECEMKPALNNPGDHIGEPEHTSSYGPVSELLLDALCEALSLACNDHVSWRTMWPEYGDLKAFGKIGLSRIHRLLPDSASTLSRTEMSQQQVQQACPLFVKRVDDRNAKSGLDLGINRWMASKRRTSYADQFIELHIALEALYLKQGEREGEKRFRLATHGAWHLGSNFEQRAKYHKTLRDTYDRASAAVHAGELKDTKETRELLAAAQDLCRKGILKRLYESEEPNWNELILGNVRDS